MASVDTGWVIPEWSFGDRIRKVRVSVAGMTQAEFADAIDVGEASLAQWETDRAKPHDIRAVTLRIQEVFGISAAWLIDVDQPGHRPHHPRTGATTTKARRGGKVKQAPPGGLEPPTLRLTAERSAN